MPQWFWPTMISGAFVLSAVYFGFLETRQENRYWDIVHRLESAQVPVENLDDRVSVTSERTAWVEGYTTCQGDVFRNWLDKTEPAAVPGPLLHLMDLETLWREKD